MKRSVEREGEKKEKERRWPRLPREKIASCHDAIRFFKGGFGRSCTAVRTVQYLVEAACKGHRFALESSQQMLVRLSVLLQHHLRIHKREFVFRHFRSHLPLGPLNLLVVEQVHVPVRAAALA
jgi:hypothetical protein